MSDSLEVFAIVRLATVRNTVIERSLLFELKILLSICCRFSVKAVWWSFHEVMITYESHVTALFNGWSPC